jgi:hypothetical protein
MPSLVKSFLTVFGLLVNQPPNVLDVILFKVSDDRSRWHIIRAELVKQKHIPRCNVLTRVMPFGNRYHKIIAAIPRHVSITQGMNKRASMNQ